MSFLNFGKKKKIPDELPDLISDEIEKESAQELNSFLKEDVEKHENNLNKNIEKESNSKNTNNQVSEQNPNQVQDAQKSFSTQSNKEPVVKSKEDIRTEKSVLSRLVHAIENTKERKEVEKPAILDRSFFSDIEESISKEINDLDSLENWYETKFSSKDVLDNMKDYWNHQKKISVLEAAGRDFKDRISEKVSDLQRLEKEWQRTYFDMIEKEEEIRDEEAELKKLLKEFMKVCKHKKESLSNGSDIQKNKNEEVESINNDGEKKEDKGKEEGRNSKE